MNPQESDSAERLKDVRRQVKVLSLALAGIQSSLQEIDSNLRKIDERQMAANVVMIPEKKRHAK